MQCWKSLHEQASGSVLAECVSRASPLEMLDQANHQWGLGFMHDTLYCGKRFRTLNLVDESTRECLAIEVDTSLPAERVVRALEQLKAERGLPTQLRKDNGPELISATLIDWCESHNMNWYISSQVSYKKIVSLNALIVHSAESS